MKNKILWVIVLLLSLLFSMKVCGDETLEERVKGTWYICYPNSSSITQYIFKEDGKVTESNINEYGTEDFPYDRFTYEIEENTITFESIVMDGSGDHYYAIDVGEYAIEFVEENVHVVYMGDSEYDVEWFLYPTKDLAIEYSDKYKYTDGYISGLADEDGFVIEDGVLKGYFGDELEVTIPDNVHTVDTYAFMSSEIRTKYTRKVIVPGTVKKINDCAFSYSGVKTIYIEEGVEEIGNRCFSDSSVSEIYIPETVTAIGENAIGSVNHELIIHCVKNSVACEVFKDYTANDTYSFTCVYDYDIYTDIDDEIRRNSLHLIILSAICIVAVMTFTIIRIKVKRVIK